MNYAAWSVLTNDELRELFQHKTGKQIAEMFGVTSGAVYSRLRTYGITGPRTQGTGPKRTFNPDPTELAGLLEKMSMRDVAKHYGVGETVVFTRVKQHGLQGKTRSERLSEYASHRPEWHNQKIADSLSKRTGEAATNWQGGKSTKSKLARTNREYRIWKQAVLEKSGFRCAHCSVEQGSICECCGERKLLHAHHIVPFSADESLRYDVDNGVALCGKCHRAVHFG